MEQTLNKLKDAEQQHLKLSTELKKKLQEVNTLKSTKETLKNEISKRKDLADNEKLYHNLLMKKENMILLSDKYKLLQASNKQGIKLINSKHSEIDYSSFNINVETPTKLQNENQELLKERDHLETEITGNTVNIKELSQQLQITLNSFVQTVD